MMNNGVCSECGRDYEEELESCLSDDCTSVNPRATYEIASDLYEAGQDEDGFPFFAETFYILKTEENGRRFRLDGNWPGCRVEHDEQGEDRFIDIRESAKAGASAVLQNVLNGKETGHWRETRPEYGSKYYIQSGAELETLEWEKCNG